MSVGHSRSIYPNPASVCKARELRGHKLMEVPTTACFSSIIDTCTSTSLVGSPLLDPSGLRLGLGKGRSSQTVHLDIMIVGIIALQYLDSLFQTKWRSLVRFGASQLVLHSPYVDREISR
jgi:hypothetical protein